MSAFTNTVRKHRPDYYLVLWTALLMLLGLVVMYAIGPQRAHVLNLVGSADYSDTYFFIKQFISLSFAVTVFFIAARIPLSWWQKYAAQLVVVSLAACVLLAFFGFLHLGIAPNINGAVRWFNLGPLGSLQPAEFLKFALLLFVAGFLGMRHTQGKINDKDTTIIPVLTVLLVAVFFVIFLQKDMDTGSDVWNSFKRNIGSTLNTNFFIPQAVLPLVEVSMNSSMFTGNPIVGMQYEGVRPAEQIAPIS